MTTSKSVEYETTEQGIAIITLNRPNQLNAINQVISLELMDLLDQADNDLDVKAVILTGAGRAFCAGADLSGGPGTFATIGDKETDVRRDWGGILVLRIFEMLKPTIAAINGVAVGIGATMTLPCDVRIASRNSKFGFVFARRGIVLDGCASWFLPRVVGISSALRWCLSGALVSADQAFEAGLVSSLHDESQLLQAAIEIALELTAETSPSRLPFAEGFCGKACANLIPWVRTESSLG